MKNRRGVTLVALVITIIVLLILAGITINLIIGEDGIIKRAQEAGKNYIDAAKNEKWQLGEFTSEMENIIGGSTNNGRGPYNSEFRNNVIAALKEQGVDTLETDSDETIIGNIGKIFEERTKLDSQVAAISDNITQGKQAYVNGQLITGTGKDAEAQYAQGVVDGMNQALDNLKVEYTYHQHSGDDVNGGGCYTTPIYHSHTTNCYCQGILRDTGGRHEVDHGSWVAYYTISRCSSCGQEIWLMYNNGDTNKLNQPHNSLICNLEGTIVGYTLGCGKTTETIESATIIY